MSWVRSILRDIGDMLLVWVALTGAQALVPRDHILADPSLLPWLALTLSICLTWRIRPMISRPHPALTQRLSASGRAAERFTGALIPPVLLLWFEVAYQVEVSPTEVDRLLLTAAPLTMALALAAAKARTARVTSWAPRGTSAAELQLLLILGILLMTAATTLLAHGSTSQVEIGGVPLNLTALLHPPLFVANAVALAGFITAPHRDIAQTVALGRERVWTSLSLLTPLLLAWAFVMVFMVPIQGVYMLRFSELGFSAVPPHTLFVCIAVGVLFPRQQPVAISCLLHEVIPVSGVDRQAADQASDFSNIPRGVLAFNPLEVRRTMRFHPWRVPVRSPRLQRFDREVVALWPRPSPPEGAHIFGEAAFEPVSGHAQWETITIHKVDRMRFLRDASESAGLRRILILRPFSSGVLSSRNPAFDHERSVYPGQAQLMSDESDSFIMRNGDIVVFSVEGVLRAYELEIGQPIYDDTPLALERPPQLEDYVRLG